MRTQVGIIGAGPAGLVLSHLLHRAGIGSVVLERRDRARLEGRIRAGVLEPATMATLDALGLGARMHREGMVDEGLDIRFAGPDGVPGHIHLDLPGLTGRRVMIYGQHEVVKDLLAARIDSGEALLFDAEVTGIDNLDGTFDGAMDGGRPRIRYRHAGEDHVLDCDVVAACDGYHGAGRRAVPAGVITTWEHRYDFAWLGVLAQAPPLPDMTYANHPRGFALCSRRSPAISRLYLQVPADEDGAGWSDDRFWDELHRRMFDADGTEIAEGPIFQRDVARLRAFVAAPMQHGRLFLAGDAVHIVPPAGAKGLNMAVADARVLARALTDWYRTGDRAGLDGYSATCLPRVWRTVRFSTHLTGLLHRMPGDTPMQQELQAAELAHIHASRHARAAIAEQYVGLSDVGLPVAGT